GRGEGEAAGGRRAAYACAERRARRRVEGTRLGEPGRPGDGVAEAIDRPGGHDDDSDRAAARSRGRRGVRAPRDEEGRGGGAQGGDEKRGANQSLPGDRRGEAGRPSRGPSGP